MTFPSENLDKFMLRLPDGMRDTLKAAAKANGRSLNAEIIHRLTNSYRSPQVATEARPLTVISFEDAQRLMEERWRRDCAEKAKWVSYELPTPVQS